MASTSQRRSASTPRPSVSPARATVGALSLLSALAAQACEHEAATSPLEMREDATLVPQRIEFVIDGGPTQVRLRAAEGDALVTLRLGGTGCPPGTFAAELSEDGETLSVALAAYRGVVDARAPSLLKDCLLSAELSASDSRSVAVEEIRTEGGFARLDRGVTLRESMSHQLRGHAANVQHARELSGPYVGALESGPIAPESLAWTQCGSGPVELVVSLRARLTGGGAEQGGELGVGEDGAYRVRVKLASRPCGGG